MPLGQAVEPFNLIRWCSCGLRLPPALHVSATVPRTQCRTACRRGGGKSIRDVELSAQHCLVRPSLRLRQGERGIAAAIGFEVEEGRAVEAVESMDGEHVALNGSKADEGRRNGVGPERRLWSLD